MKAKKSLIMLAVLLAGYILGVMIGWPNQEFLTQGEIGKVSQFNKKVTSEQLKAFEDKIYTDSVFKAQTLLSLIYINSRTKEFNEYAKYALNASSDVDELSEINKSMMEVVELAQNAEQASEAAIESLCKILEGNSDQSYEQLSYNTFNSFQKISNAISVAKDFVDSVDAFLEGKDKYQDADLAFSRDLWAE